MIGFLLAVARAQEDDELLEHTFPAVEEEVVPEGAPVAELPAAELALAALALGSDVSRIEEAHQAVELIYERRYKEARHALEGLTSKYPTSGMGPFGLVLIYQALMFENFDFRYEQQYRLAYEQARGQLAKGNRDAGDEALESFLSAALLGIDAIHVLRKGDYLIALDRAVAAKRDLDRTRELAPAFKDALLGEGMYVYWRTVVTRGSKLLPDFPDKRTEGIALMLEAERGSAFLGAGSTLALAYAYIQERQLSSARDRCLALRIRYADNIINNQTLGRIYTSQRRYPDALRVYDEVLRDDPTNQRTHYFRGLVLGRMGRQEEAAREYQTYLRFPDVPEKLRSSAWYRLGNTWRIQGDPRRAEYAFRQAIAAGGNEAARKALAEIR